MTDEASKDATVAATAERAFDAPRERVFDAWCDPQHVPDWFAPGYGPMVRVVWEPRPGEAFHLDQRRGDGVARHWGVFLEVSRPVRLAFTWRVEGLEEEDVVTFDLEPEGRGCTQTTTHLMAAAYGDDLGDTEHAWRTMMDGLAEALERDG